MHEIPTPEAAIDAAIRHWRPLSELAAFALAGHGFGDSDGGFGVQYPGDQDDYDRAQVGAIPSGYLRVYGFWGPPEGYELELPESLYLQCLARALDGSALPLLAKQIRDLPPIA